MELMQGLLERRSCKRYRPDPVPREVLEKIVEAGLYAPSGRNLQAPIILAVTNRELRDRLSALNAQIMGADSDPFYGAPAVLVVLAKKDVRTRVYDGSLVMGNLMLAAEALGVNSCWIHRARETFELDEGKEILRQLGVEGEYEGIGNCILGYADGELHPPIPRAEGRVYYAR